MIYGRFTNYLPKFYQRFTLFCVLSSKNLPKIYPKYTLDLLSLPNTYPKLREAINKKKSIYKDIGFICFDPLPPPPNKDIKNKDILLIYLTPSLVPKIRTYEPFVFGFKKPDFAFFSHNFYGVGKFKKKLVKCS